MPELPTLVMHGGSFVRDRAGNLVFGICTEDPCSCGEPCGTTFFCGAASGDQSRATFSIGLDGGVSVRPFARYGLSGCSPSDNTTALRVGGDDVVRSFFAGTIARSDGAYDYIGSCNTEETWARFLDIYGSGSAEIEAQINSNEAAHNKFYARTLGAQTVGSVSDHTWTDPIGCAAASGFSFGRARTIVETVGTILNCPDLFGGWESSQQATAVASFELEKPGNNETELASVSRYSSTERAVVSGTDMQLYVLRATARTSRACPPVFSLRNTGAWVLDISVNGGASVSVPPLGEVSMSPYNAYAVALGLYHEVEVASGGNTYTETRAVELKEMAVNICARRLD